MQNSGYIQWNMAQINAEATGFKAEHPVLSPVNMMVAGQLWTSCIDARQPYTADFLQLVATLLHGKGLE